MRMRALLAGAALTVFALPAFPGQEAEALTAAAATRISDPVRGAAAFSESIDVPAVARFTLGKNARRISDDDSQRFAAAFDGFIASTFRKYRDDFTNAEVEVIGSVDRSAADSIPETRVTPPGKDEMTVRWRVMKRDGEWRVVDIEVLGLWLVIEQRAQIAAIPGKPRATIDDAIGALSSWLDRLRMDQAKATFSQSGRT
ncbi:MAG: ABC transporter substrate-binding protein [Hyphomonas sp.]|uniref:phospholipid-binding protein MlaC n=1 Tax=Hyphomonas sp. TaxID=87 RepID=UPI0034A09556